MAAQLTRILLVPYDAQHLPIKTIKFIKKDTAIQFEVEVPKDNDISVNGKIVKASEIAKEEVKAEDQDKEKEKEKEQDTQKNKDAEKPKEPEKKTKILAFTYELTSGKLALIEDYKEPLKRPRWASVSPDEKTVIFARGENLFMMDAASFKLAQKKADDKAVKEEPADDGRRGALLLRPRRSTTRTRRSTRRTRRTARTSASRRHGSSGPRTRRRSPSSATTSARCADLWVINSLANPRPTLETYRYEMPGEEKQPQPEILVFDLATKAKVKIKADKFKDQTLRPLHGAAHGARPGAGVSRRRPSGSPTRPTSSTSAGRPATSTATTSAWPTRPRARSRSSSRSASTPTSRSSPCGSSTAARR